MHLTTKGRYAVMAILEIASQMSNMPVTLAEIFAKLKKANIVRSAKGRKGGYIINEKLDKIKIANIIDAVDENIEMTRFLGKSRNSCVPNKVQSNAHHLWLGLSRRIRDYFDTISIADML
ncbi:MAG: Rrf2 family transcriptional regulator [Rickettsia endosymbiont of Gnoriste bilineata]|nr:Rrf2 family transcriptional regulator [Rickettsia endosymbiont of Gnoriste bilineata]